MDWITEKNLKRIESYYLYEHDGLIIGTLNSSVFSLEVFKMRL